MGMCIALLIFLGLPAALIGGYQWGRAEQREISGPRPLSLASSEILRRRYASGALTRRQYQDALIDVLKDRYVREEIDLPEYEEQLVRLLSEERTTR